MRTLLTVVFLLTLPMAVVAEEIDNQTEAINWLLKVSEAARHRSYEGVMVYRDAQRMETMRIVHRHKDGREQERLTSLNGPPRDVFREDDHVTCILSDNHAHDPLLNPPPKSQRIFPAMSRETLGAVAPHYQFRDLGRAAVAGHECRGLAIQPRDGFRYGYQIWADARTFVPLKVSLIGARGQVVEEMMFTRAEFPDSISDQALAIPKGRSGVVPPREPEATPVVAGSPPRWLPSRLPPGFRVTMRSIKPSPDGNGFVEHVLLSDGLSAVSVFTSRMRGPQTEFRGLSNMGGINVYGRMLGTLHFTVVGEVPSNTVRFIGDALQDSEGADAGTGATAP